MAASPPIQGRAFGKYTLIERIGSGGMAEIWRASLRGVDGFEKILCLKRILPQYARNRSFITMFVQEAKLCSVLHHPNIVQIYELGEYEGDYFIAMELVQGMDLLRLLTRASKLGVRIPAEICLFVISEVCKGLSYAHTASDNADKLLNIVHLDVSPSNILLSNQGDVKLTDFGVARAQLEDERGGGSGDRLKGKLGYMSPEQVTGKPIDRRSDLFSVGIILYEMFTLKRLFLGKTDLETLTNIRDADIEPRLARHSYIPPPVQDMLRKSLARNPDSRYQWAEDVEEVIDAYLFDHRTRVTRQSLAAFIRELDGKGSDVNVRRSSPSPVALPPVAAPRASESPPAGVPDGEMEPVAEPTKQPHTHQRPERQTPVKKRIPVLEPRAGVATFEFRHTDGSTFGPVTVTNVRSLAQTHAISPDELVRIDGGRWVAVREVPELQDLLPANFLREPVPANETGPFGSTTGPKLIYQHAREQRSGRLKVIQGTATKEVFLRRGKAIHITSSRKGELLGSLIAQKGLIDLQKLADAMHQARAQRLPLGDILVRMGHISQNEIVSLLEEQFRERFLSLFSWHDGRYEFFEGQQPGSEVVPFLLDLVPVVTEGIRRHYAVAGLEEIIAPYHNKTIRLVSTPPFDMSRLRLTPREARFRAMLEERPTQVAHLLGTVREKADDRAALLFVLFVLMQSEHIRIG